MTNPEQPLLSYDRPPITEAVIGITFSSPIKEAELLSVKNKLLTHYPDHQLIQHYDVNVDLSNKPTTTLNEHVGHRLSTRDMTELLLIQPATFSLSQLAPYPGWDIFLEHFVRDWATWKRVIGFRQITRIGVRFINRIDIPVTGSRIEYEDFLNIYPKLPSGFDLIEAYAVQISKDLDDIGCHLKINTAAVPSPILGFSSFVVDIDISKETSVPQSDNDIYKLLGQIRTKKNDVFEACVSDRSRGLFQ